MNVKRIKSIETEYKGIKFRSKLEARWAVFFDLCQIKWEYEPEGYELDGVRYLPDFLLHDVQIGWDPRDEDKEDIYVEVKGLMTKADINKIKKFVYGSETEIKDNLLKEFNYQFEIWKDHGLEIPEIPFVVQNKLVVLGMMPLKDDFKNIKDWLNRNYGNKSLPYGTRAIYSYRIVSDDFDNKESKFIPMTDQNGSLFIRPVETFYLSGKEIRNKTIEAYYQAVNYKFDHRR